MQLLAILAIAGGAGSGDEDVLNCCGIFPILPLVAYLAAWAVYHNSARAACGAVLLAGLPYLLLRQMMAGYQPSDDEDVMSDQQAGRQAVVLYGWMVVVASASVLGVAVRRLAGRWARG